MGVQEAKASGASTPVNVKQESMETTDSGTVV
jgi:hypothetical protein